MCFKLAPPGQSRHDPSRDQPHLWITHPERTSARFRRAHCPGSTQPRLDRPQGLEIVGAVPGVIALLATAESMMSAGPAARLQVGEHAGLMELRGGSCAQKRCFSAGSKTADGERCSAAQRLRGR